MNEIRRKALDVRDHYEREVWKGRVDQQRTIAIPVIEMLLLDKRSAKDLKLAASRYAKEVERDDAMPIGCRNFYLHYYETFLEDWEPPPEPPSKWKKEVD